MLFEIKHANRDRCCRCSDPLDKAGFFVADETGSQAFLCASHLIELLRSCLTPVLTNSSVA